MNFFKYLTFSLKNHFLYGENSIEHIIMNDNGKDIELMLKNNWNINEYNFLGDTALYIACHHEKFSVIDILLKNGADPNMATKMGYLPIICLAKKKFDDFKDNEKLLAYMEKLINYGADINTKDREDNNCLAYFIENKNYLGVKLMLSKGINIHAPNGKKEHPLIQSAYYGKNEPITDLLLTVYNNAELNAIQNQLIPFSLEYQQLYEKIELQKISNQKQQLEHQLTDKKNTSRVKL